MSALSQATHDALDKARMSAKRPASFSFEDYFRSRDLRLTSLSVGHDGERHRHMFTLSDGSYFETSNAALAASLYEALLRG